MKQTETRFSCEKETEIRFWRETKETWMGSWSIWRHLYEIEQLKKQEFFNLIHIVFDKTCVIQMNTQG